MIHEPHQDRAATTGATSNIDLGPVRRNDVGELARRGSTTRERGEPTGIDDGTVDPGRLSKRQRRRRRKPKDVAAAASLPQGLSKMSAELGAKVAEAERALRTRDEPPAGRTKPRRRRGAKAGSRGSVASPAVKAAPSADSAVPSAWEKPVPATPVPSGAGMASVSAKIPVYAALDLGTNNCRLLVAVPTRPGQFRVIDAFSRIVRLGEGLGRTGSLAGTAMDRAVAALEICSQKLSAREICGARLIATEACRAAANGEEFIERVHRETGLKLEIVSRETEARLAVSGCGSLVDRSAKGAVLFDIGGGSSEIALLDLRHGASRRLSNHIVAWTSLPVGVVSLAERHGGRNVTPELFERMIREVEAMIDDFPGRHRLRDLVGREGFHLLGTSGTVTTLAGVHLELERYDRRQVDGLWLSDEETDRLVARIAGWSFEERVANPCIGSDRADLVLAGCAILEAIRRVWPAKTLRVADRGLREGLLTEMMVADGVWRRAATAQARQTA
ncbi:exopolyphosphatase/guanosine-5'-triphosphate,3'-diphosphate pyrophosphatase [Aureimonas pseudogalii]|uniref:Exopolyphosphatase/guanosine-5'-triphosphate, 3'-diphosphate pyrophosphatase n=2 Tax=Aureimonas pseudogalii TaxID=1744844 RepID=A0A7W6H307_9HYPH|nr:exopolyphosphatase/guanosine-5'-triphosphate,3'-diphosphate pyrophosphatase [Aureimonas pseudogalii]